MLSHSSIKEDSWRISSAEHHVWFISGIWRSYKYPEVKPADLTSGGRRFSPRQSHNTTTLVRFVATAPHAAFRTPNSPQLKAEHSNIHQKTPAWMNRPPEIRTHRVYVTDVRACCSLPECRHMWRMHAGCVNVCTAFCLYYKLHLSLSL